MRKRTFLKLSAASAAGAFCTNLLAIPAGRPRYGQGDFVYEQVPGWGELDPATTPVKDCHGIVCTDDQHIILLTNDNTNNIIIYDTQGKLVSKWGTAFPDAHGLSLVREQDKEVLFITDRTLHAVFKTTLDGTILDQWDTPLNSTQYSKPAQYKPSWTLHPEDGSVVVLDGYGRDYFIHYDAKGTLMKVNGGQEDGIKHWGPHGGMVHHNGKDLIIAMSDQQTMLITDTDCKVLKQIEMPGGNPRSLAYADHHYFVAHLADNWPTDRQSRGFISITDKDFKVVSNVAGTKPVYDNDGVLQKMAHQEPLFIHPHDVCVDKAGSLYCAQFASNQTYPIKLSRV
jgi:hypothetical protein